jgi:hypothetical protein
VIEYFANVLLTLLSVAGAVLIVVVLVLHAVQIVALRREARKRAELIRLRVQEEPGGRPVVYRKIPISLSRN